MTRVGLVATGAAGFVAGIAIAEFAFGATPLPRQALPALAVIGATLALAAVTLGRRSVAGRAVAARPSADTARRVQALAAKGARPATIARDTRLPVDLVQMALRTTGDASATTTRAAGSAAPTGGTRRGRQLLQTT